MYKLPAELPSKYEFVTLAAKRAEQLQMGARPRVEPDGRKFTVVAQDEVAQGIVGIWNPDDPALADEAAAQVEEE